MKNFKHCYAIINNKLEKLYISHQEEFSDDENDFVLLVCGLPGTKIEINSLKSDKKKKCLTPKLFVDINTVLF